MAVTVSGVDPHMVTGTGTWQKWGSGGGSTEFTGAFLAGTSSRGWKFTGTKGMGIQINASGESVASSVIVIRYLLNGGFAATLAADGGVIRVEDTSGNTSDWTVAGSDTYDGGWQVVVCSTTETETANSGTAANLALIRYIGMVVNASGGSGGDPNFLIDMVLTIPNAGLTITGNSTALFSDVATDIESNFYGVVENRSGVIFSKVPIILSPDASDFTSTDETLVFEDPFYEDGTNIDSALDSQGLSSADSDTITLTRLNARCAVNSLIAGTESDKKLDFTSAGDINADTCTFDGFDGTVVHLGGTGNTYDDCSFSRMSQIVDTGAVVRRGFVRNTSAAATESALLWTTSSNWEDTQFIMGSTNSHAIEVETNISDNWIGFTFTGYGTTGGGTTVGDEVFNSNNPTGASTINASGVTGTISYYQRGAGTAPTINNNVTGTFTPLIAGSEVRVYTAGTKTELDGVETSGTSFGASVASGTSVDYVIHHNDYEYIRQENYSWPTSNQDIGVAQRPDRNYLNP